MPAIQARVIELRPQVEVIFIADAARVAFVVVVRKRARQRVKGAELPPFAAELARGRRRSGKPSARWIRATGRCRARQPDAAERLSRLAEEWTLRRISCADGRRREVQFTVALQMHSIDLAVIHADGETSAQFTFDADRRIDRTVDSRNSVPRRSAARR